MKLHLFGMSLLAAACSSCNLFGQVVMLPTIGNFSVNTSVAVPDSGGAFLGGNNSYAAGSTSRGPFRTRGIGGQGRATNTSTFVQIIDLEALDHAILEAAQDNTLAAKRLNGSIPSSLPAMNSQSRGRPSTNSNLASNQSAPEPMTGATRASVASRQPMTLHGANQRKADYDYLMILSHPNHPDIAADLLSDISHDLDQARAAKAGSRWSTAQHFYEKAWGQLSPERQQIALEKLNEAKAIPQSKASGQTIERKNGSRTSKP